jgi:hypothetical protein
LRCTWYLGTSIDLSKRIMLRCTWYMLYGRYFLWILAILRNCDLKRLHFFCLNIDLFIKISGIDLSKRIALGEVYSIQHYVIKICQLLAAGQWFSPATRVSSINKTDHHDKTAILLKVVLITITPTLKGSFNISNPFLYHTTIWFVSDLRHVGGFLRVLCFPPPNKTDRHNITEILLKVVLNTINLDLNHTTICHCRQLHISWSVKPTCCTNCKDHL